jgi:diphthamide biosynthesis methyltransferase
MPPVSRKRHLSVEARAAIQLAARQRVDAVWTCLDVLCPDLALEAKKVLAEKVLDLSREEDQKPPRIMITPAQVTSII